MTNVNIENTKQAEFFILVSACSLFLFTCVANIGCICVYFVIETLKCYKDIIWQYLQCGYAFPHYISVILTI